MSAPNAHSRPQYNRPHKTVETTANSAKKVKGLSKKMLQHFEKRLQDERKRVLKELGRADASVRGIVSVNLGLVGKTIVKWGTDEQKSEWLPELTSGRRLAAFGPIGLFVGPLVLAAGIGGWLPSLDYVPSVPPPDACRVPSCGRWTMPAAPFCHTHCQGWRRAGRPGPGEFAAARADPGIGCEWIDVRCLLGRLRLEIQYVLQCRGDERQSRLRPVTVQQILRDLAATGAASLLERTEEQWAEAGPRGIRARGGRQFTLDARARIEQLAFGSGWEVEYPRDKWRLRNLGIQPGKEVATIDFAPISQPWLAALAKRWCRWRLSAGLSAGEAAQGPTIAVRLQELFGLNTHPSIAKGAVPLVLELLSPAHRPVQVTRDLPGFWRGSYAAVRSDLRGRYPRHPWPEDPASAMPTPYGRP